MPHPVLWTKGDRPAADLSNRSGGFEGSPDPVENRRRRRANRGQNWRYDADLEELVRIVEHDPAAAYALNPNQRSAVAYYLAAKRDAAALGLGGAARRPGA